MFEAMWNVVLLSEVDTWYLALARSDSQASEHVTAAVDMLASNGPSLGRPIVDRIKGSTQHNMKELRPSGTNVRILFIFDPARNAVLLVAGNKTGNWKSWYDTNIPLAKRRYAAWLAGDHDKEV